MAVYTGDHRSVSVVRNRSRRSKLGRVELSTGVKGTHSTTRHPLSLMLRRGRFLGSVAKSSTASGQDHTRDGQLGRSGGAAGRGARRSPSFLRASTAAGTPKIIRHKMGHIDNYSGVPDPFLIPEQGGTR